MNFFAILLFCCATYYVDAQYCMGATFSGILTKCSTEHGATPEDVEDFLSEKKAASDSSACFRACVLQNCKAMNAAGDFDHNVHKPYLQVFSGGDAGKMSHMEGVFEKCYKVPKVEGKLCDTAENFMVCLYTNSKAGGWNFHKL